MAEDIAYIFSEDMFEMGGEVDAYCTSCRTDTTHMVVTRFEGEIRSVQCTICHTTHSFRPPRGEVDDDVPEPMAVRKRQSRQKMSWNEAIGQLQNPQLARGYNLRDVYHEGEVIRHPTFGVGYVSELVSDNKLESIFRDGPRMLVFNRPDLIQTKSKKGGKMDLPMPPQAPLYVDLYHSLAASELGSAKGGKKGRGKGGKPGRPPKAAAAAAQVIAEAPAAPTENTSKAAKAAKKAEKKAKGLKPAPANAPPKTAPVTAKKAKPQKQPANTVSKKAKPAAKRSKAAVKKAKPAAKKSAPKSKIRR